MNKAEREFQERVAALRYRALRSGWPDFLIVDEFRRPMAAVELKGHGDSVQPHQAEMHVSLHDRIPVVVLYPDQAEEYLTRLAAQREREDAESIRRGELIRRLGRHPLTSGQGR